MGYLGEKIVELYGDGSAHGIRIDYSFDGPKLLGTGGALRHAAARLDDRFLLANGDSIFATNLAPVLAAAARDPADVLAWLVTRRVPDASRAGLVETGGDRVSRFHERPPVGVTEGTINGGLYVVHRALLDHVMAIGELFYQVRVIYNRNGAVWALLMVATVWYLLLTTVLSIVQYYVERHFAKGATRHLPETPWQRLQRDFRGVAEKILRPRRSATR